MRCCSVGVAVNTAKRGAWAGQDNGVGDGAIGRIDGGAGAIGSGRVMAGAATAGGVPVFDGSPGLDLAGVATAAATAFAGGYVAAWIVAQPMGNRRRGAMFMAVEVVKVALIALTVRRGEIDGAANPRRVRHVVAVGTGA